MSRVVLLALVAILVPLVAAEKLQAVIPCTRGNFGTATVQEIRITPCPEAARRRPCILKKGSNVTIEVDFKPTVNADRITGRAFWASRVLELPLPGMNTDACLTTVCPLRSQVQQTYRYFLPISPTFPNRRYDVKWKLQSAAGAGSGAFNMCFQFPIQIVN